MKTRYPVKKSRSYGIFLISVSIFILFICYVLPNLVRDNISLTDYLISSAVALPVLSLFLWIWKNTSYKIENEKLFIKNGPFWWEIDINTISKIRLNQVTWAGIWKPTLSWNCFEIKYKKSRSVFITPKKHKDFLNHLKTINPSIEIK